jgi:DNA-binding transcriptional MerR regulator
MTPLDFDQYIGKEDPNVSADLIEKLIEPRFTLGDFQDKGINSRTLFHWNKEGLVWKYYTEPEGESSWNRFSFIEFIWLKIVILLRRYGIPFAVIKNFKKNITGTESLKQMIKISNADLSSLKSVISDKEYDDLLNELNSDSNIKEEYNLNIEVPIFLLIIVQAILVREDNHLLINDKGDYLLYSLSTLDKLKDKEEYKKEYKEFLMYSYFSVSLYEILKDFVSGKGKLEVSGKLEILSQREVQVIEIIRNSKNLKSVNIRFDADNNIDLIEETKNQKVEMESRLMEFIMKNGYHNIEITTENGKIIKCLNTRKTKLKDTE